VSAHGAAIVVLGVRLDESDSRRNSINKHQNLADSKLTPHTDLQGAFIYRPIVHLTIDDVVTTVEIQGAAKIDFPWSMRAI
jgi:DNA sulfur modification protein DndC